MKNHHKLSAFSKLMAYNNPKSFIFFGVLAALIAGCLQPALGVILSQYLGYMAVPIEYLKYVYPKDGDTPQAILEKVI